MPIKLSSIPFKHLGGVRTDKDLTDFDIHEALVAKNARLGEFSKVATRKGGAKFNPTKLAGSGVVQGLFDFKYGSGSQKFLEVENGIIYTDDSSTRTSIKTGLNSSNYYDFTTFDSRCWIANNSDAMQKYDGTVVTQGSITQPEVGSFAAAEGGAGSVDGVVIYLVTFYNSTTGQESNPFPLTDGVTITVSSKIVNLSAIPVSTDSQVNSRRIYRTSAGGAVTTASLLATINDNTTTVYADNIADVNLGITIDLSFDPAPVFVKTVEHKNRGFGFTDNSTVINYSRLFNFWYWPQGTDGTDTSADSRDYREFAGKDDGDKITNIISYYDYLIIFKENSVYVLEGYDQTTFSIRKIDFSDGIGCVGHRAAAIAGNWCYFIDKNGIYRTNAQRIEYVGEAAEAFFNPSNPNSVEKVSPTNIGSAIAIKFNVKPDIFVTFSLPTNSQSSNSLHLNYYYEEDIWCWDDGFRAESWAIKDVNNLDKLMRGDDKGWVWTSTESKGEGGVVNSTATSGTSTTLTDSTQSFTTDIYDGVYVEILSGTGVGQRRLISSNTATELTVDEAWATTPDTTSVYTVGGIDFYYLNGWNDYGDPTQTKRLKFFNAWISPKGNFDINGVYGYDLDGSTLTNKSIALTVGAAWDVDNWDVMYWDNAKVSTDYKVTDSGTLHRWSLFGIRHKKAGQRVELLGFTKVFQRKGLGIR